MTFFPDRCAEILFFGACPPRASSAGSRGIQASPALRGPETAAAESGKRPAPEEHESVFAEPQRGPDGKLGVYVPPKPVREFLETPTPENAAAYQQWNLARLHKVLAAQAVLDELNGIQSGFSAPGAQRGAGGATEGSEPDLGAPGTSPPPSGKTAGGPTPPAGPWLASPPRAGRGTEILYLLATWCPFCAKQTPIIAEFVRAHPEVPVVGIALDSRPETVAPYAEGLPFPVRPGLDEEKARWAVRAFPTIVIVRNGVPVGRATGLMSMQELEVAVGVAVASGRKPE